MVRGLFGSWVPGHLAAPLRHFAALGWQVEIGRTSAAGTLEHNVAALGAQIDQLLASGRRPIFLAHSKGALEVLLALAAATAREQGTAGLICVQAPRGGAPYLEHLFPGAKAARDRRSPRPVETLEAMLLTLLGARAACSELNTATLRSLAERLDPVVRALPALMVASSATAMSNVLELRSKHLERRHPGQPHDGVFLTRDQTWPGARMLTLDGIDHAPPSVGGLGFAHQHFWAALPALVLD
jgi:hypothetical protein